MHHIFFIHSLVEGHPENLGKKGDHKKEAYLEGPRKKKIVLVSLVNCEGVEKGRNDDGSKTLSWGRDGKKNN